MYQAIVDEIDKLWRMGYNANGVRMSKATQLKLGDSLSVLKAQSGFSVASINTEYGNIRVLTDERLPDGTFIVTMPIPPLTRMPGRAYYLDGELVAEQE
jgi:hypothetical protein